MDFFLIFFLCIGLTTFYHDGQGNIRNTDGDGIQTIEDTIVETRKWDREDDDGDTGGT